MKFDVQSPIIAGTNSQDKRVVGLAWSPDGERLAVAFTGRSITIITVATNAHSRIPVKGKDESSNRTFTISGISLVQLIKQMLIKESHFVLAPNQQLSAFTGL